MDNKECTLYCLFSFFKLLSANPTKWLNTFKQLVGNLPTNCLIVFDHFVGLTLKVLNVHCNTAIKERYLGHCQLSMMEFFCGNNQQLKTINCFYKKASSYIIVKVLNTSLYHSVIKSQMYELFHIKCNLKWHSRYHTCRG